MKQFDQIIVLSKQDKTELMKMGMDPSKILLVPPIVTPIKQAVRKQKMGNKLLFIGPMWWKPNLDAANWLLKEIFPLIQKSVSLTIIGEGARAWGRQNHVDNSIHTVEKPKNIVPYLARCNVFVAPFRAGGGVRIKILTAMAHSVPIVSTSIGMRGLLTRPEVEYLEANEAKSFARQVMRLLDDPKLSNRLTINAARHVNKYHAIDTVQRDLLKSYGKTNH